MNVYLSPEIRKHKIINDNSYKLCIFEIQIGTIMNDDKIQYKKRTTEIDMKIEKQIIDYIQKILIPC